MLLGLGAQFGQGPCNNVGGAMAEQNANISGQGIIFKLFLSLSTRPDAEQAQDDGQDEDVGVDVGWLFGRLVGWLLGSPGWLAVCWACWQIELNKCVFTCIVHVLFAARSPFRTWVGAM